MSTEKKPTSKLLMLIPVIAMLGVASFAGFNYSQTKTNQLHVAALAEATSSVNHEIEVLRDQGKACSAIYSHNDNPIVVIIECDIGNGQTSTTTQTFTITSTNTINSTETEIINSTNIVNSTNTINSTQTFTAITNSTQIINSTNVINSTETIPVNVTSTQIINSTTTIPVNVTSTILTNETTTQTVNTTITQTCSDFGNGTIICQ